MINKKYYKHEKQSILLISLLRGMVVTNITNLLLNTNMDKIINFLNKIRISN